MEAVGKLGIGAGFSHTYQELPVREAILRTRKRPALPVPAPAVPVVRALTFIEVCRDLPGSTPVAIIALAVLNASALGVGVTE